MSASLPGWLYLWYAGALTLLATVLSGRNLKRRMGDLRAYIRYFASFFLLLGAAPAAVIALTSAEPARSLAALGLTAGRWRAGLALLGVAVPVVALLLAGLRRDRAMAGFYPFSKQACASRGRFLWYEAAYLLLYYPAWEFAFRGALFFPVAAGLGLVPALAIQTLLSTLLHIGHPCSEIVGAAVGGVVFGLVAWYTGSILYGWLIHAGLGIAFDFIQYCRRPGPGQASG